MLPPTMPDPCLHILAQGSFLKSFLHLGSVITSSTHYGFLLPSYKDPCDYTQPTWVIQDNLPSSKNLITAAKSLLTYNVTFKGSGYSDKVIFQRVGALFDLPQITVGKKKLNLNLTFYTKISSKWIIDLNFKYITHYRTLQKIFRM
jgi:hypothetical protein